MAFGGKGKAFEHYRKAILGDEAQHKGDGMSESAKAFFGAGLGGLVPVIKRPPRKES